MESAILRAYPALVAYSEAAKDFHERMMDERTTAYTESLEVSPFL